MEKRTLTKYLILVAILGLSIALAALTTKGQMDPTPPIGRTLPATFPPYRSVEVLYCVNPDCPASVSGDIVPPGSDKCPLCESAVGNASLAERQLLPADTTIDRRLYIAPSGRRYAVAVVEGGYERRSIHKPQVCLVAQGNSITLQQHLAVPLPVPDSSSLDVTVMELNGGKQLFCYWFTDGNRETASHLKRLFWIAWDGVVHNVRRRWAYISIITRGGDVSSAVSDLERFIPKLHHELTPPQHP